MYVTLRKAKELTGLCGSTLRKYADEGKIPSIKNFAGQRLFDLRNFVNQTDVQVIYARVSTKKQSGDLENQIQFLKEKYPFAEIISDVGSGLTFKRKGLLSLLERCLKGDKLTIIVSYRDRLARFGFDLIKWVVERNGGHIVVENELSTSPIEELTRDITAIITVFSSRLHGLRSYKIKKDQAIPDEISTASAKTNDGGI